MPDGSSQIPTGGGRGVTPQHGEATLSEGQAAPQTETPQASALSDNFSKQVFSELLEELKRAVTRQGDQQFDPVRRLQQASTQTGQPKRALSSFEKIFLEVFAGLKKLGRLLKKGQFKFRCKKKSEWKEFYERVFPYVQEKTVAVEEVAALIFRGLSDDDPRLVSQPHTAKGLVLVADIVLKNGRTDKLARLAVAKNGHSRLSREPEPGTQLTGDELAAWIGVGTIEYLSLSYKPVRPGLPSQAGGDFAQNLRRRAADAARAREAMLGGRMGFTTQSEALATEATKNKTAPTETERKQSEAADKHSLFRKLFGK